MKEGLIIVPSYNEEDNIGEVLIALKSLEDQVDIIVVNDGSTDGTGQIARNSGFYVVEHPCNLGYGAALQTGFKFAVQGGYRYIVLFDADGQHRLEDLNAVLREIGKGESDIVIGSRFLGDPSFDPGWMKRFAVFVFRVLIRRLTGQRITDPTSGLKGMNRKVFTHYARRQQFPEEYPDANIIIDMLLHQFRLLEIPIGAKERQYGTSMHSGIRPAVYMMKVMLSMLAIWVNHFMTKRKET